MKRVALVVGVNHYRDQRLCPLYGAHEDAGKVQGFLEHRGGFESVRTLTGDDANQRRILEETRRLMGELDKGDLFVFFFAGHGVEACAKHWLLCPEAEYDEESEDVVGAIPVSLLKSRTAKEEVSRLFILDACRGKVRRGRAVEAEGYQTAGLRRDLVQPDEGCGHRGPLCVLCSCDEREVAHELPKRNQGLFSVALLEKLTEYVEAGREVRVGTELADAIGRRMARLAREHGVGGGQQPWMVGRSVVLIPGRRSRPEPATELEPGPAESPLREVRRAIENKDLGRAEELAEAAVHAMPGSTEAEVLLGGIREWQARVKRLVEEAGKAVPRGEFDEAEKKLREAAARWEKWPELHVMRRQVRETRERVRELVGEAERALGETALGSAERSLEEVVGLCPEAGQMRERLEEVQRRKSRALELAEAARSAIGRGEFEVAEAQMEEAAGIWRSFSELTEARSLFAEKKGGYTTAMAGARAAIGRGDLDQAVAAIERAQSLVPGSTEAEVSLEGIRKSKERVKRLMEEAEKALLRAEFDEAESKLREAVGRWANCRELLALQRRARETRERVRELVEEAERAWGETALGSAERSLEEVVGLCPEAGQMRERLEEVQRRQSRALELAEAARSAIGRGEFEVAEAQMEEAAGIWRSLSELTEARSLFAEKKGGYTTAMAGARAAIGRGDLDEAGALIMRAQSVVPKSEEAALVEREIEARRRLARDLVAEAEGLEKSGEFADAARILTQAEEGWVKSEEVRAAMAWLAICEREYRAAMESARRAKGRHEHDAAVRACERALGTCPHSDEPGSVRREIKREEAARQRVQRRWKLAGMVAATVLVAFFAFLAIVVGWANESPGWWIVGVVAVGGTAMMIRSAREKTKTMRAVEVRMKEKEAAEVEAEARERAERERQRAEETQRAAQARKTSEEALRKAREAAKVSAEAGWRAERERRSAEEARRRQWEDPQPGKVVRVELGTGVVLEMVGIPPGEFMMGSPKGEEGRSSDEVRHKVTLTKGFWLGKYAVTQDEYEAVMGKNPSKFKGARRPVEQVSWHEVVEFCNRLSKREGLTPCYSGSGSSTVCNWGANGYRLPTEAEWEYACRAGTKLAFYTGECTEPGSEDPALDRAGWYDKNSGSETHEVGQKEPNAWGLYDMHGNVWEWCGDWCGEFDEGIERDPRGPSGGSDRVVRGGSWFSKAGYCRSASRHRNGPDKRWYDLGFRLARSDAAKRQ